MAEITTTFKNRYMDLSERRRLWIKQTVAERFGVGRAQAFRYICEWDIKDDLTNTQARFILACIERAEEVREMEELQELNAKDIHECFIQ